MLLALQSRTTKIKQFRYLGNQAKCWHSVVADSWNTSNKVSPKFFRRAFSLDSKVQSEKRCQEWLRNLRITSTRQESKAAIAACFASLNVFFFNLMISICNPAPVLQRENKGSINAWWNYISFYAVTVTHLIFDMGSLTWADSEVWYTLLVPFLVWHHSRNCRLDGEIRKLIIVEWLNAFQKRFRYFFSRLDALKVIITAAAGLFYGHLKSNWNVQTFHWYQKMCPKW